MPSIDRATPRISVRLYKSIMRKPGDAGLPTSERYANKEAFIDLTPFLGDGASITTGKNVRQPAGTFSVTFADRPNLSGQALGPVLDTAGLESVYGLAEPMDIIEIRMWGGLGICPNPLPIKMRGFITEISRGRQMGNDGKPIRTVVVNGQDYGKVLQSYQILYLPSYQGSQPLLTGFNFFEQFGADAQNTITGGEFIKLILDKAINPMLDTLIPKHSPMPRVIQADIQSTGMMNNSYMNTEGSVYNLFTQFLDVGIWNELFIEDREDGVFLVWRPVPAFDLISGKTTQGLSAMPIFISVPDNKIVSIKQSRSDEAVFNYYWCTNQRFDLADDMYRRLEAFMAGGQNETMNYPNTAHKYYGIRAMYADSVMTGEDVTNQTSGLPAGEQEQRGGEVEQWLISRRQVMIDNNKDNVVLENGSVQMKGGPTRPKTTDAMKPGDYITVLDGQISWSAYAVNIQDNFIPYRSYTTNIDFERGTGFAERVSQSSGNSPWLKEQATRKDAVNSTGEVSPDPRLDGAFDWLDRPSPSIGWTGGKS